MACIEVHRDVGQVQLLKSVLDARIVRRLRICALCYVEVGHHVRETVGLDDEKDADVAECGDLQPDGVDVCLVIGSGIERQHVARIYGRFRTDTKTVQREWRDKDRAKNLQAVVRDAVLAVRRRRSTITVWQVVNHEEARKTR